MLFDIIDKDLYLLCAFSFNLTYFYYYYNLIKGV